RASGRGRRAAARGRPWPPAPPGQQAPAMTTPTSGKDRTPARRAVPTLVAAGLVLVIAWLLVAAGCVRVIACLLVACGRLDHQPHPPTTNSDGPTSITIPAIGVHAPIV